MPRITTKGLIYDNVIQINNLLNQLYNKGSKLNYNQINKKLEGENIQFFSAKIKGKIIAMGSLIIVNKLSAKFGLIEDFVVDKDYIGKGIGTRLLNNMIKSAKNKNIQFIDVHTRRIKARAFYLKKGFSLKNTHRTFYLLRKRLD